MALEAIGFDGSPEAILVGFRVAGDHPFNVCIEPETGPHEPSDFAEIVQRAATLYDQHPDHNMIHTDPLLHEERQQALRDRMRAQAIVEVFEAHSAGEGMSYFASQSTRVDDYDVHVVLSVLTDAIALVPQLNTTERNRYSVSPSLVHAVINDILHHAKMTLHLPNPGRGGGLVDSEPAAVVRRATARMVGSALLCSGYFFGHNTDSLLSSVSALPYEGRAGVGKLILAKPGDPAVEVLVRILQPVGLRKTRAVRKLMEASDSDVGLLVGEGDVYGLGRVLPSYDPRTETVFVVSVLGRGAWDLCHDDRPLLSVRDGAAHLPVHVLDEGELRDRIERLIPGADVEALVALARAAGRNEHGAMLVISTAASEEAQRLSPQSWEVEPVRLSSDLLSQLTAMDGAVLVDSQGECHAIGVILDGRAAGQGDPARGSRFNNAVRYLNTDPPSAVVVVYSSDGTIDILPWLHPRVRQDEVSRAVERYVSLAATRPPDFANLSPAWDRVKSLRFYLSEKQCREVNAARTAVDDWQDQNGELRIVESDLVPDPSMNSSYWLG